MTQPHPLEARILRHEQFLRLDPGNLSLRMTLGDLYHEANRLDDALAAYEQCDTIAMGHAPARSRMASVLLSLQRFEQAEAALQPLVDAEPNDPALHHNLGLSQYFQHRFEAATASFRHALALGAAWPATHAYLARSLHHLAEMDEAITAARRWLALEPSAAAHSALGLMLFDDGDIDGARREARAALDIDPDDLDANIVAGSCALDTHEAAQATAHFGKALSRDPDNGRAWFAQGLANLHEQRLSEAVHALLRASQIHADNPGYAATLGWAQLASGDASSARAAFERAIALEPNYADPHAGLAAALTDLGELAAADDQLAQARAIDPQNATTELAQSKLLAVRGQAQASSELMTQLLARTPAAVGATYADHLRAIAQRQGLLTGKRRVLTK